MSNVEFKMKQYETVSLNTSISQSIPLTFHVWYFFDDLKIHLIHYLIDSPFALPIQSAIVNLTRCA